MNTWLTPVTLTGETVILMPLAPEHKDALVHAASDGELWTLWYTSVPSAETIDQYLRKAFSDQEQQTALPFVVIDKQSGKVIGATRFCNVESASRRLEIGYTWYSESVQRTGVNTECKHLLLEHAFEVRNAIAVEFRTNWYNFPSRKAIARLGAKQDGVLRNHRIDHEGNLRDTVVFSIISGEWPGVKRSLRFQMERFK